MKIIGITKLNLNKPNNSFKGNDFFIRALEEEAKKPNIIKPLTNAFKKEVYELYSNVPEFKINTERIESFADNYFNNTQTMEDLSKEVGRLKQENDNLTLCALALTLPLPLIPLGFYKNKKDKNEQNTTDNLNNKAVTKGE